MNKFPIGIYILLISTPCMIAMGQLLFKLTSNALVKNDQPFIYVALNPVFIIALAIYGSATLLWIYVLKTVPLAYAYSFMALTFAIVPILSYFFLAEKIDIRFIIGSAMICLGLIVIHN